MRLSNGNQQTTIQRGKSPRSVKSFDLLRKISFEANILNFDPLLINQPENSVKLGICFGIKSEGFAIH